jgi:hypothetical protein
MLHPWCVDGLPGPQAPGSHPNRWASASAKMSQIRNRQLPFFPPSEFLSYLTTGIYFEILAFTGDVLFLMLGWAGVV